MGIEELNITPMERVTDNTANPTTECLYPKCEGCSKYFAFDGEKYCTVPMVVTKQIWLMTEERFQKIEKEIRELWDEMFTEEIEVTVGKDGKLYRKSHAPMIVIRETP